jgi:hypothetical protein
LAADATMRSALDDRLAEEGAPTGPSVARALSAVDCDRLVAASSMPVRDVDAHTVHRAPVIANRGASGIDGFVSTTLGVASVGDRTVALAGDLSLLHDAGGFVTDEVGDVVFVVIDNGVGISQENLTCIFAHGFTTRKDGHGFGLHGSALSAREMGGTLTAHSDGPSRGATFTLEIPLKPAAVLK